MCPTIGAINRLQCNGCKAAITLHACLMKIKNSTKQASARACDVSILIQCITYMIFLYILVIPRALANFFRITLYHIIFFTLQIFALYKICTTSLQVALAQLSCKSHFHPPPLQVALACLVEFLISIRQAISVMTAFTAITLQAIYSPLRPKSTLLYYSRVPVLYWVLSVLCVIEINVDRKVAKFDLITSLSC